MARPMLPGPIRTASSTDMATAPASPSAGLRGKVLYIEDLPINFVVVESILSRHPGIQVLHAETGLEGVRRVHEDRPDFVLLDMHLPDISGLEVVRRLSEHIAEHDLLITLLTADRFTMEVVKAMSLGAFEALTKPVDAVLLEAAVRRALTGEGPARRGGSRPR